MTPSIGRLLEVVADSGFECIVIGGVAAIGHGAATPTDDLDVVAPMTEANLERLMTALQPYHPKHATRPDLAVITDPAKRLAGFRLLLLDTDLGRLDVLRTVEPLGEFAAVESLSMELVPGRAFRVITLEQLIEVKAHLRRPKDNLVAHELRAIQARRRE